MSKKEKILRYVLKERKYPSQNRKRVGQSLILLSVGLFAIFLINFAIIIGTDTKFGQDLSEGADQVHQIAVTIPAKRGTIYDRTGAPIAEDSTTYTVYAIIDTKYVSALKEVLYVESTQFDKVADILHKELGIEKAYAKKQLQQPDLHQVYFGPLGKNISYGKMVTIQEEMEKAGIKGISFDTRPGRMYFNGNFASLFIGLAQLEDNEDGSQSINGQSGMERALDGILSGQDGKIIYEKDSQGRVVPGTEDVRTRTVNGQDVYTTISTDLQRSLENNMNIFQERAKGKYTNATLVSAKTGEILATTQRPSFDADTKEGLDGLNWQTMLYQGNYEPGSTMKIMTLASSIDNGTFNPNDVYTNTGYQIADVTIDDWTVNSGMSAVTLNYAQGFSLSSNVGMTRLQQAMGDEKWLNYLNKFRFGYPTRFGMVDEDGGLVPDDNIVTIAMSSFGQGISVTQNQMLRAFLAIGNDGVMLEPKFISALYDPNTDSARFSKPEVVGKPVSEKAAQDTRRYMIDVGTDPYFGTLYSQDAGTSVIQVDGYNVAVKSGTAEIAKEDGSGYLKGQYINSVVAMLPAEDPEFIMYVTIQQPQEWGLMYWQDIVNPVLKEAMLLKDTLNLDSPAPSLMAMDKETEYFLPDVVGKAPGQTADELRRHLVQPIILGNGDKIEKVSVPKESNLVSNQQILLLTSSLTELPDMYGWKKENVDTFSTWLDLDIFYEGEGSIVVKQDVETGTDMKQIKKLTLTLGE